MGKRKAKGARRVVPMISALGILGMGHSGSSLRGWDSMRPGIQFSSEIAGQGNYDAYAGNAQVLVKGQRTTAAIQAGRLVPQWDKKLVQIQENTTPWLAFTEKLGGAKEVAGVSYFSLLTDILPQTVTYGTAGETGTTLTLAAGEGNNVRVNDLLFIERTRECMRITAFQSADVLTVVRAFGTGSGAAAAPQNGEVIQIQGSAFPEGSTAGSGLSSEPNKINNNVQTFREFCEATGRDINAEVYGGPEWQRIKADAKRKMEITMEKQMLFSESHNDGDPSTTMGLLGHISTNSTNQAGVLDEVSLAQFNRGFQRHNVGREKDCVVFCGDNARSAMDAFGRDALRLRSGEKVLGMNIESWVSSFGALKFMAHALMTPLGGNCTGANRGRIGMMIGCNMSLLGMRAFKGRKMVYSPNIELPGTDGTKDGWLADVGFSCQSEKSQALMYGITG